MWKRGYKTPETSSGSGLKVKGRWRMMKRLLRVGKMFGRRRPVFLASHNRKPVEGIITRLKGEGGFGDSRKTCRRNTRSPRRG